MFFRDCALLCLAAALAQGCCVKEDRTVCPCILYLDFSCTAVPSGAVTWHVASQSSEVISGMLEGGDLSGRYALEVPRDSVKTMVVSGDNGAYLPLTGLRVNEGEEFSRLYLSCHDVDTRMEEVCDTVFLHREHAVLYVHFKGALSEGETVEVTGSVCGCGADGTPVSGPFRVGLAPDGHGLASVCLPRQIDGSLALAMYDGSGLSRVLKIGEYIIESGYDWSAADLKDITVEIDLAFSRFSVTTEMWKRTLTFTIVV